MMQNLRQEAKDANEEELRWWEYPVLVVVGAAIVIIVMSICIVFILVAIKIATALLGMIGVL